MAATISLELNPNKALSALKKVDDVVSRLKKNVDMLNTAMGRTVGMANALNATMASSAGGMNAVSKGYQSATRSATAYARAAARVNAVAGAGSPNVPGPSPRNSMPTGGPRRPGGGRPYQNPYLSHLIGSTRLGVGHFAPLLGRLVPGGTRAIDNGISAVSRANSIGGPGLASSMAARVVLRALGPIGTAIAIIGLTIKALSVLGKVAGNSAAAIDVFTHAATGGGQTGAGVSVAAGSFFGTGPGLGRQVGQALQDGFGRVVAAQAGVNPVGGPFGDIDYNKKLIKVLELIAHQKSFTDARRVAEMLGIPELAKFKLLPEFLQKALANSKLTGPTMGAQVSGAAYDASSSVFSSEWEKFKASVLTPIRDAMTGILLIATWILKKINDFGDWMDRILGGGGSEKDKATKANTDAVDRNTKAMRDGTYGGGPRARGAYPQKFMPGQQMDDARRRLKAGIA